MNHLTTSEQAMQAAVIRHRQGIARGLSAPIDSTDPDVRLILEGLAIVSARTELLFEEGLPELGRSLLESVFPGRTSPVPPLGLIQIAATGLPPEGVRINRGAILDARPGRDRDSEAFRDLKFATGVERIVRPITVSSAAWSGNPARLGLPTGAGSPGSALIVTLESTCRPNDIARSWSSIGSLRFQLDTEPSLAWPVLEALANDLQNVVVRCPGATGGVVLDQDSVSLAGFEADEMILPDEPGAFLGYRLLREFFLFPTRFHSFELRSLGETASMLIQAGSDPDFRRLELIFGFGRPDVATVCGGLTSAEFRLNVVPVINAFDHLVESHQIRPDQSDYELVAAPLRSDLEVIRLDLVEVFDSTVAGWEECRPLLGGRSRGLGNSRPVIAYQVERSQGGTEADPCDSISLSLTDDPGRADPVSASGLRAFTLCSNRNLAASAPPSLPFQVEGHPELRGLLIGRATPALRHSHGLAARRRLPTHLSFHTLSASDPLGSADWLQRLLLDFAELDREPGPGLPDNGRRRLLTDLIGGIGRVSTRTEFLEHPEHRNAFIPGKVIEIEFDGQRLPGGSAELFGRVLSEFLAIYCSTNSFTRLVTWSGESPERSRKVWPARAGRFSLR